MSGGHHGPSSIEEIQEAEELKAAEQLHERIKGFYLTTPFDAKIEGERLGIRHDLEHALEHEHHKKAQDVIVDVRVTEQLRKKVKEHKEHDKTAWRYVPGSAEWRKNRVREIKDIGRVFKNPLRWFRDDYDEHAAEIEHEYGDASDVNKMKKHLTEKFLSTLASPDLDTLWGLMGGTPPTPAVDRIASIFAQLTPLELDEFKQTTLTDPRYAPFKPLVERNKDFERFAELRQLEATEKAKVISVHIHDPHRLRQFVIDKLVGAPPGSDEEKILQALEGSLGEHFYNHLQGDYKKCKALARIENHFETGDKAKLVAWVESIKTEVADKLPETKTEQTDKEKEQATRINESVMKLRTHATDLSKRYNKALPLRQRIQQLKADVDTLRATAATARNTNYSTASDRYNRALDEKVQLVQEIQALENDYKNAGNDFVGYLEGDLKKTVNATSLSKINEIKTEMTKSVSSSDDIFDEDSAHLGADGLPTPKNSASPFGGDLAKHISKLAKNEGNYANDLSKEAKSITKTADFKPKLTADHFLFEMNIRAVKEIKDEHGHQKFTDEAQIYKVARMATSFEMIDAKNVELFRAGNREIAQGKVKGWKGLAGVWRKSKQQIASGFFNSETFKGRDIIEHIAGLDHAFECFKDLPVDASLADIRSAIKHHGGISNENLMKFYLHLQEALKSFTVGHHRKVEIMDRDWPIEQVALFAEKIHAELEAREFVHKIEHPDTPEDKKLKLDNKAAYFQKLLNEREESQKKLEAAHLEQMRRPDSDWQVSWVKSLMKGKFGEAYQQALAKGKEQGLSGKALRDFVSSEGSIPKTVLKHLMTGLALKEAYDITSKSTKWIGSKLFNASKKAATVGVEKGGSILGAAWRNLGKPAAGATGRGLKAVGRGALRVGKFAAWDIWKFSFWTAPKWTVQKAWNITTFPFRMVGRGAKGFWNFFHYTEEKRARDAAWYAGKKAASAHAGGGGHGGGGHGGGH